MKLFVSLVLLLCVAACGKTGNIYPDNGSPTPSATPPDNPEVLTLTTVDNLNYGQIIVDGTGRAVYLLSDDTEETSTCTVCPAEFTPVLARDRIDTLNGLDENLIGVNGSNQVLYNGHLLYYYVPESTPGHVLGQNKDNKWFLLDPQGNAVSP